MLCPVSPPGSTPSRSRTTPACAAWLAPCRRGRMAVKGRRYTPWSSYGMEDEVRQAIGETMAEDMPHALARLETSVDVVDPTTLELKIANWNQMRTLLTAYISQNMKEGIDYYTLTIGGKESKPSLSKAGSETFLSLFNLQARFRKDDETWEMLGRPAGVICYVCALYTKRGEFVGEGRGAREVRKDKDINKAIKMAQKSSQCDAVLRTGSLSDYFTQDLEDQPALAEKTVRQQKKRIVALLQQLGAGAVDRAGYEAAVLHYTGLALASEAYQEIIDRLEVWVTENLPDRELPSDEISD